MGARAAEAVRRPQHAAHLAWYSRSACGLELAPRHEAFRVIGSRAGSRCTRTICWAGAAGAGERAGGVPDEGTGERGRGTPRRGGAAVASALLRTGDDAR